MNKLSVGKDKFLLIPTIATLLIALPVGVTVGLGQTFLILQAVLQNMIMNINAMEHVISLQQLNQKLASTT